MFTTKQIRRKTSEFVSRSQSRKRINIVLFQTHGRAKRSSSSASCDASWIIWQGMGSAGGEVDTTIVDETECLSSCLHDSICVAVDIRQMVTGHTASSGAAAASRDTAPATIECRIHQWQGRPRDRTTIPGTAQYEVLKRCGVHPGCEPLWVERYNMKGAHGVLMPDLLGLDSCKTECVNNRACTSLHVYLHPRKGPTECWHNYDPQGSADPSSLLQSIRYLHLGLVDRCGASSQNASQLAEKLGIIPTTSFPVKRKSPIAITLLDVNIILVSWACITAVSVLSVVFLYHFKIRSMDDSSSSTEQSFPEDNEPQTLDDIYIKP